MATKQKTRKINPTVNDSGVVILPEYSPKDPDIKFTGGEPLFVEQPSEAGRKVAIVAALSWYGRYMDRKVAKDAILALAAERGVSAPQLKVLRSVSEKQYNTSICWLARLAGRGLVLNDVELAKIGDHLWGLMQDHEPEVSVIVPEVPKDTVVAKTNVQEIMVARAREAAGELEGLFDDYVMAGCPQPVNVNVVGLLTKHTVMAQHVGILVDIWTARKAEYEEAQSGKDAQLKEGYSQHTKIGMRNMLKWCDAIIAGLQSYTTVKKAARKPRARKAVPIERQVANVKFLKSWKDDALKLELISVHPIKLVGATEAFVYDTAKRRLTYYVADSHAGTLGVRGTTITGFDTSKSQTRTLRKPGVTLPALMKAGKPAARKVFTELTTVGTQPNGRTNDDVIILRVA